MAVPKRYSDMLADYTAYADFVAINGTEWLFTAEDQTYISARLVAYVVAFNAYIPEATRNKDISDTLSNEWDLNDADLRKHQQRLKHAGIPLTPQVINAVGVPVDAVPRAVVNPPNFAPGMQIQLQRHLITQLYAYNPTPGFETKRGRPDDVSSIAVWKKYTSPGEPTPTFPDFSTIPDAGRTVFDIRHTLADVGKVCHITTAYRNARGVGPRSVIVSFPVF